MLIVICISNWVGVYACKLSACTLTCENNNNNNKYDKHTFCNTFFLFSPRFGGILIEIHVVFLLHFCNSDKKMREK